MPFRIAITAQSQHQSSDGIGRIVAVGEQLFEVPVARHSLILLECLNQMIEKFDRKGVLANSLSQCHEHRMTRLTRAHSAKLLTPPGQQSKALLRIADFVS